MEKADLHASLTYAIICSVALVSHSVGWRVVVDNGAEKQTVGFRGGAIGSRAALCCPAFLLSWKNDNGRQSN